MPMQPIHLAAKLGSARMVNFLANKGADINEKTTLRSDKPEGQITTPICIAARQGHYHVVEALVKRGAIMKCDDVDDAPMLHQAVRSANLELVRFLLHNGLQPSEKCKTPACMTAEKNPYERYSNEWGHQFLAENVAAYWGMSEMADLLRNPNAPPKTAAPTPPPSTAPTPPPTAGAKTKPNKQGVKAVVTGNEIANLTHAEFHSK